LKKIDNKFDYWGLYNIRRFSRNRKRKDK